MPQNLTIFELNSGSVSSNSLTFLGQPGSSSLYQISFKQIVDYLNSGSGTAYDPTQLNQFSASVLTFTGSVAAEIFNVFSSQSGYLSTGSFNAFSASLVSYNPAEINLFTSSISQQVANVYASESNYTNTASFNSFTSSINSQVSNVYGSQSVYLLTGSFNTFSASVNIGLNNILASESNYLPSSSFSTFSASVHSQLTGSSINTGSLLLTSSFNSYTSSISTQILNVYSSESNYTLTSSFTSVSSSFVSFSSSYVTNSSSFLLQINNVYSSESNYTLTSSFLSFSASVHSQLTGSAFNTGSLLTTASFNTYTGSVGTQIVNVFASQSNYLGTGSFSTFSSSVSNQFANITGSGGSINTGSLVLTSSFNAYTASLSSSLSGYVTSSLTPNHFLVGNANGSASDAGSQITWNGSQMIISTGGIGAIDSDDFAVTFGYPQDFVIGNSGSMDRTGFYQYSGGPSYMFLTNGTPCFTGLSSSVGTTASVSPLVIDTNGYITYNSFPSSSGESVNTGSLLLTSSFNTYTSSISTQISNVYASESKYVLTSSFQQNGIGTTITSPILLQNSTSASSGNQQISPSMHFQGQGWMTGTPASQPVDGYIYMLPVQGSTVAGSSMVFALSQYTSSLTNVLVLNDGGGATLTGAMTISNNCFIGASSGYTWGTAGTAAGLYSDANYETSIRQGTHACQLQVYNTYTSTTNNEGAIFGFQTNANTLSIGTSATGSGTLRQTQFVGGTVNLIATAVKRTTVSNTAYTASTTDYLIGYTSLSAAQTVTLPTAVGVTGQQYIIKDETGNAGSDNITVAASGSQTIDGASSKTISTGYGYLKIYSNGSNWFTTA